jgi:outer membrane protein TolC
VNQSSFINSIVTLIWCCFLLSARADSIQTNESESDDMRLTLEEAYQRVLKTDQTIGIAYEEIRKSNLLPFSALTRVTPRITGGLNYNTSSGRSGSSSSDRSSISSTSASTDSTSSDLTIQQTIFDLTTIPAYRHGKLSAESSKWSYRSTIRDVLLGVTQAFFDVLRQSRLADINQQILDLNLQQLRLAQARFEVGEITKTDVLRAQVTVEQARRALIESKNTYRLARNILTNTLNFGIEIHVSVVEPPLPSFQLEPLEVLVQRAYDQREDYRVKGLAIDQSIENRKEVIAEYAPKVIGQFRNEWNEPGSSREDSQWQASVGLQFPLFEGGQRELDLMTRGYEITQARLDYQNLAKSIEADVKQAWLNIQNLQQTAEALQAEVAAARDTYQSVQVQYRAGLNTSLDVLSALQSLNSALNDEISQKYDYQIAIRNLEHKTGDLGKLQIEKISTP